MIILYNITQDAVWQDREIFSQMMRQKEFRQIAVWQDSENLRQVSVWQDRDNLSQVAVWQDKEN